MNFKANFKTNEEMGFKIFRYLEKYRKKRKCTKVDKRISGTLFLPIL